MTEVPIRSLPIGQRFRFHLPLTPKSFEGTLLRVTQCSALVQLDGIKKVKTFVDSKGASHTLSTPNEPIYWAPETPVEKLNERVDVEAIRAKEEKRKMEIKEKTNMVALPGLNRTSKVGKVAKAGTKKASAPENDCMCGCGAKVRGRFRMGHDGGFYSKLRKIVSGEMKMTELNAHMRKIVKDAAGAKALIKASGH